MKKILLFIFMIAMLGLYAQDRTEFIENHLKVSSEIQYVKELTDTIFPDSYALPCGQSLDSLAVFTLSSTDWIFGCNSYGDTEGAQVYDIGSNTIELSSVMCWIQKMGMSGNLYARIYEVNSSTLKPTTLIATSDAFPNSNLPTNPTIIQMAEITFSTPVSVTGKFAVSVEWICDFANSSACGLASTRHGCVVGNEQRSWIKYSDGSWNSSQSYTSEGNPLLTDLYFLLKGEMITEIDVVESEHDQITCYPVPSTGPLTITSETEIEYIRIFDQTGKLLMSKDDINMEKLEISLDNLENGLYIIQAATIEKVITKRIIKQ